MFAKFFIIFFSVLIVLGLIGLWMKKRDAEKGSGAKEDGTFFSEEEVGNVNNLNDRFNRARYMDGDGK